jgi:hypothetical protein
MDGNNREKGILFNLIICLNVFTIIKWKTTSKQAKTPFNGKNYVIKFDRSLYSFYGWVSRESSKSVGKSMTT